MEFRKSVTARLARRRFVGVFNSSVVNIEMTMTILPEQEQYYLYTHIIHAHIIIHTHVLSKV